MTNGIREATEADIPRLVAMGRRFITETSYSDQLSENPERLQNFASELLVNPACRIFVAESEERLVGMLALLIYPHPMSGEKTAVELCWWVEPEARGGRGLELLKAAEEYARSAGAKRMQVIAPNQRVAAIYKRRGFMHVEDTFQRVL